MVVNVYITMPHIKNDISMQLKPLPIQFDVVKIVVQVRTGNRYCPFVLKTTQKTRLDVVFLRVSVLFATRLNP